MKNCVCGHPRTRHIWQWSNVWKQPRKVCADCLCGGYRWDKK